MPIRIIGFGFLSLTGLVASTTIASVVGIGMASPLSDIDKQILQNGNAQEVMSIMLGLCVTAIVGLCLVVYRLFKVMEKRHILAHKERDRREEAFHSLVEKMLVAVADSNAVRQETNKVLERMEVIVSKCHESTTILTSTDAIRVGKGNQ